MNMKRVVLAAVILLCILPQCQQELPVEGEREIWVSFSAQSLSSSLLKSAASTPEKSIDHLLLYGVDAQGNVAQNFPVEDQPSLSGISLTVLKNVKTLYAIANPSADMIAANPANLSDLMNMTGNFAAAPQSPFLMSGQEEINCSNVQMELFRTVAKVQIISKNEFQINSVTVKNTPNRGYVFGQTTAAPPSAATMTDYPMVNTANPVLYVAENSTESPTQFLVSGTYLGNSVNYTIVLKMAGANIDIERNTHYEVGISAVSDTDCSIGVTIPEWNNGAANNQVINVPGTGPGPNPNYLTDGIRILAIGNSYSQNTMIFIHKILVDDYGIPTNKIKIVSAYLPGGYLTHHVPNMQNHTGHANFERQEFRYTCSILWTGQGGQSWDPVKLYVEDVVEEDDWDVITMQQADNDWASYPSPLTANNINYVVQYLADHSPKKDYKLGWHMTWSSSNYNNQQSGYNTTILSNTNTWIKPRLKSNGGSIFDFMIPAGTAVQRARNNSFFGDELNCAGSVYGFGGARPTDGEIDHLHLNNVGSYLGAVMWIKTIMGLDLSALKPLTVPSTSSTQYNGQVITITQPMIDHIVTAVNAAHADPYTMY